MVVPAHLHAPILQDAVLLAHGETDAVATAFLGFLRSEEGGRSSAGMAMNSPRKARTAMSDDLLAPILLTTLASVVTVLLLMIATPIAWWLARSKARWKRLWRQSLRCRWCCPDRAGFLPPDFVRAERPGGWLAGLWGDRTLAFSFEGSSLARWIYSLPLWCSRCAMPRGIWGTEPLEAAATLGASSWQTFRRVAMPLARPGYLTGAVLSFAHTMASSALC